jgi:tetratricopeptide (TPR) repeat protein
MQFGAQVQIQHYAHIWRRGHHWWHKNTCWQIWIAYDPWRYEWTIIITKQLDVTSPAAYKQDQDVVRVKAKPEALPFAMETFTIMFGDVKANSIGVGLLWDKTYVEFPITTDVESKVMAQIDQAMNKDNKPYFQSAMYYVETGKDLNKANEWFDKAIVQTPEGFWIYYQKANCLAKLGKKQDALAASNKSIELAKAAKNDDYVALNTKLQASLK